MDKNFFKKFFFFALAMSLGLEGCGDTTDDSAQLVASISTTRSTIEVSSYEIPAGETATVTLRTLNQSGMPIIAPNLRVRFGFSSRGSSNSKESMSTGTFDNIVDHNDGSYTAVLTGGIIGVGSNVTAQLNDQTSLVVSKSEFVVVSGKPSIEKSDFLPLTLSKLIAGNTQDLTFRVKDRGGNFKSESVGKINFINLQTGTSGGLFSKIIDNEDGTYTSTFTATRAGSPTDFVAQIVGDSAISLPVRLQVLSGAPSNSVSTLSVGNTSISANGVTPGQITFALKDANGNPLVGKKVSLVSSRSGGYDVVTPSLGTTDDSGQVLFNVTSLFPGTVGFTAFDSTDSWALSSNVTLNFIRATLSTSLSTLKATPKRPVADGATSAIATVALKDTLGNPIIGKLVGLSSNRGGSDTITPATRVTDSQGNAVFSVVSSTIGLAVLTASDLTDGVVLPQTDSFTFVPSDVNAVNSTLALSSSSIVADGLTSTTVTVTLKDIASNLVSGKKVTLSSSRNILDTISPSFSTTDLNGQAVFTVTSKTLGVATLTATDSTDTVVINQTGSITFLPGLPRAAQSTVVSSAATVIADGVASTTVTVTLKDLYSNVVSGKVVSLSSSRGGLDTIAPSSVATNSIGQAVFTVISISSGSSVFTGTDVTDSVVVTQTATTTFKAGAVTAAQSLVSASPASLVADGAAQSTVLVTLRDANSNPVSGKKVSISSSRVTDQVSANSVTNASGVATFTVGSTLAGSAVITATDVTDTLTVTQTATITFQAGAATAAKSTLAVSPTTVVVGGTLSTITVTLKDVFSNPVPGKTVNLASSRGASDTIVATNAITDSNGQAVFTVSSNVSGSPVFTATDVDDSLTVTQTGTITFKAGVASASLSTVNATIPSATADGSSQCTVMITLNDMYSNPAPGRIVQITSSRGSSDVISSSSLISDSGGTVVFNVTSTVAGSPIFTVTDSTDSVSITQTGTVTFVPGAVTAAQSTVSASPTTIVADGLTTSTISVTLKDVYSNRVPGKTVSLSSNRGMDTISSSTTTDSSGVATFTVKSTAAGSSVYTATDVDDSLTVTQTSTIAYTAGSASGSSSTVSASVLSIPANGSTTSTITVTLKDTFSNLISGKTVTLASSRGASDTISPASATTNASGIATFTVKSSTLGTATLTATDVTDSVTLTQTISIRISLSATQVSGYQSHFCALMSNSTVQCWGSNYYGQLGDGTTTDRSTPVTVSGITTATAVSVGSYHSCALLSNSTIKCWGLNSNGQLGNGTTTSSSTPVAVSGITTAVGLTSGSAHSCARLSTNAVSCWGLNSYSQLGDGTTTDRSTPVSVSGVTTASAISAQYYATCVLLSTSTVKCWGYNGTGGIGDSTTTNRTTPTTVSGITTATALTSGHYHSCVLITGATLKCWGDNTYGQLGDNTVIQRTTPVAVTGLTSVTKVAGAGQHNTCAIITGGQLKCWGDNSMGQIGDGTVLNRLTGVNVTGVTTSSVASGGQKNICAVLTDGSVRCWGANPNGNLGNGVSGGNATPVTVSGITSPASIRGGWGHTCALAAGGTIQCVGLNIYGQLGDGTTTDRSSPVTVSGITNAIAVSVGAFHTCALLNTNAVMCWGYNANGAVGDGTTTNRSLPTAVSGISTATAVAAGALSTCALLSDQTVQCWGNNAYGTVGDGTVINRASPVAVLGLSTATSISLNNYHACSILSGGTTQCWGLNSYGQLGDGTNTNATSPVTVSGLSNMTKVSAGGTHSCALINNSTVQCWGNNSNGAVGDNSTTQRLTPTAVSGITTATSISTGYSASCALLSNQTVQCWGSNTFMQLGDGTAIPQRLIPTLVTGVSSATSLFSGAGNHSCAILSNGTPQCWGSNSFGQLGTGSIPGSRTAVSVLLQ